MIDNDKAKLKLDSLHDRHVGLTQSLSGTFFEAASVCLGRHHDSPVDIAITHTKGESVRAAEFQKPDVRMSNAWANDIDTTEFGAYGVCLAAVELEESLVAVRRAETLTGADWYVAPIGTSIEDLEGCLRLEVSGIDAGGKSVMETRLKKKVEQTKRGASNLPAIASVVAFKERAIVIQRVGEGE